MKNVKLWHGDCLEQMKRIPDNKIDTILTDPPYGLNFMNKEWDGEVPAKEYWEECLRVAKEGAFLLAFGGTRTWHRLAVSIEDAGWELRDTIMWLYGSGFPKSHNISKAMDKKAGVERRVVGYDESINIYKDNKNHKFYSEGEGNPEYGKAEITIAGTPESQLWDGWGTALKPAYEPIIVAMKPISGTFVENALEHGVAGLWIDGSRISHNEPVKTTNRKKNSGDSWNKDNCGLRSNPTNVASASQKGRFPANLILDEEAGRILDEQTGNVGGDTRKTKSTYDKGHWGNAKPVVSNSLYNDSGGASRFFYCAKASKKEKNAMLEALKNDHPSVKPLKLMRYLARLTKTPTGGNVLDLFMGSGSTGLACVLEGRKFIGIEREKEHFDVAKMRIEKQIEIIKQKEM